MTHLLTPKFSLTPHLQTPTFLSRFKFNHNIHHPHRASISCSAHSGKCSLSSLAPLEAILFDIDGTVGFNGGVPITEEFFFKTISGQHNANLATILFPDWEPHRSQKILEDKEAYFRRLASEQLQPMMGLLPELCRWVEEQGLKRAAVTSAPRSNV